MTTLARFPMKEEEGPECVTPGLPSHDCILLVKPAFREVWHFTLISMFALPELGCPSSARVFNHWTQSLNSTTTSSSSSTQRCGQPNRGLARLFSRSLWNQWHGVAIVRPHTLARILRSYTHRTVDRSYRRKRRRRRRRSLLPAVTEEASTTRCRVAPAQTSSA